MPKEYVVEYMTDQNRDIQKLHISIDNVDHDDADVTMKARQEIDKIYEFYTIYYLGIYNADDEE